MPRPEVAPPRLPDSPFAELSSAYQARCICWNLRLARKRAGYTLPTFIAHMRACAPDEALSLSYLGDIERGDRTPKDRRSNACFPPSKEIIRPYGGSDRVKTPGNTVGEAVG